MAISRSSAARLCTAQELELVEASHPSTAKHLSPARLRQKVSRSRKLRDKYRDLSKRQRLEARGKRDPRSARPARGHENTDRKVRLFQETLERFETALKYVSKRESHATGAQTPTTKKTGAKKAGAKKNSPVASQTTLRQRKDAGTTAFGKTLRARGRAANQRNQKRQDNRGR
jgi:hypothetical protein